MRQLFGKSFWTERTVNGQTNSYASLIAIMISEAGTAFGDAKWATTSTNILGLWMQGVPGAKYSPYLGIVFSNFNPVAGN